MAKFAFHASGILGSIPSSRSGVKLIFGLGQRSGYEGQGTTNHRGTPKSTGRPPANCPYSIVREIWLRGRRNYESEKRKFDFFTRSCSRVCSAACFPELISLR